MKVIDLTSKTQELRVRLDPSPVYDLLAALYVVENWSPDQGFEVERQWIRQARRALGAALRRELRWFVHERGPVMGLVSLLDARPGLPIKDFLKVVSSTPPAELLERILTAPVATRAAAPLLREVLHTRSSRAIAAFMAAYPREYRTPRARVLVSTEPAEVRERLVGLLQGFYAVVYQQEEARVLPLLRADVQAKEALARELSAGELVERATGGYAVAPGGEIAQVVLAPSYFFRPYNLISEYPGVRVLIYPVEVTGAPGDAPGRDLARLFKALGDETRLRILQLLADREMYLQEIANRLGVTHVTAIHHLALLRAVHVVRIVERNNLKYYQLRPEMATEVSQRFASVFTK